MYLPATFRIDDPETLHDFIRRYNFGTLITHDDEGMQASHLTFILEPSSGVGGRLSGHMARANPQWQSLRPDIEVFVIFQGPHAYVSPSWYSVHPSVPTWNYTAVHAYGRPRLVEDQAATRSIVGQLIAQHEAGFEKRWAPEFSEDFWESMLRQIVAFEIDLTRVECKFKLSQNRGRADRDNVAAEYEASSESTLVELGRFMRSTPRLPD
ncbi:MAG TPA: FMN-binding negative transcriptional regulator [Dehalococcoidia bacterium]|nr:FMN-binding negative transcriptional regulator [Dehalococcoidia bacterium]